MRRTDPKLGTAPAGGPGMPRDLMTVSQLAAADEPPHAVRYYCRIGLLVPSATSDGFTRHAPRARIRARKPRRSLVDGCRRSARNLARLETLHARRDRGRERWRCIRSEVPSGCELAAREVRSALESLAKDESLGP